MFVESLSCGWIQARQAAGADPDETARLLLARMDDHPYGFCDTTEGDAVKAFESEGLQAFERQVRARFVAVPGAPGSEPDERSRRDRAYARRRWGEVLRAIYSAQHSVEKYVSLCEQAELLPADCEAIAGMLRMKRKPKEALAWVNRGLELEKKIDFGADSGYKLAEMKRSLLEKLGRGDGLTS